MVIKLSAICSKQSNGSYFANCPELKGCFTQGDTYEQAMSNLKELVELTISEELTNEEINELMLTEHRIFTEMNIYLGNEAMRN